MEQNQVKWWDWNNLEHKLAETRALFFFKEPGYIFLISTDNNRTSSKNNRHL